jgi:hypothetical protein
MTITVSTVMADGCSGLTEETLETHSQCEELKSETAKGTDVVAHNLGGEGLKIVFAIVSAIILLICAVILLPKMLGMIRRYI